MWGLRILPLFLALTVLSFMGTLFIEANPTEVTLRALNYEAPTAKLGLVVLVSLLGGTLIAGFLCSIELLALQMQNRRLRKRISIMSASNRSNVVPLRKEESTAAQAVEPRL